MRPRSPTASWLSSGWGVQARRSASGESRPKASHWPALAPCSNAPASIRPSSWRWPTPSSRVSSSRSIPAGWPFRGMQISSCGGRSRSPGAWAAGGRSDRWDCVTIASPWRSSTELDRGQSVSSPGQDAPAIDPAWLKLGPRRRDRGLRQHRPGPRAGLLGRRLCRGRSSRPRGPRAGQPGTLADPRQPAGCRGRGPARGGPLAASPGNDLRLARRSPRPVPAGTRLDRAPHRRRDRGSSDRRRDPSSTCRPRGRAEEAGEAGTGRQGPAWSLARSFVPSPARARRRPAARLGAPRAHRPDRLGRGDAGLGPRGWRTRRGIVRELIRWELARARRQATRSSRGFLARPDPDPRQGARRADATGPGPGARPARRLDWMESSRIAQPTGSRGRG